jgi:anti-sigma factor RsiW
METAMACERVADERFQADKMDVLYGEADAAVRARVEAHLAACPQCRGELAELSRLRRDLQAWRLPEVLPAFLPRGLVIPRWLAAAAALLVGLALGLGVSGYVSLRRELGQASARAAALEEQQRQTAHALESVLTRSGSPASPAELLTHVEVRLDERIRRSEAQQAKMLEAMLETRITDWSTRAEAQRRLDLARVAEGLSYLDGQHGQQLARTNELISYVLANAREK